MNLQGTFSKSTLKVTNSTITEWLATNPACDASSPIILTSDTEGTPIAAGGILSITSDDYLLVDYEKVPLVGNWQYVSYLFGLNN